uniref:Homing endonuclease LAGLIDADG domain-containing protein n=1 Tax=Dactylella sp. TaxID=1814903 RepID=A0A482DTZ3_9PEZI|nr:hypothetical protein [Dactylella sp.]
MCVFKWFLLFIVLSFFCLFIDYNIHYFLSFYSSIHYLSLLFIIPFKSNRLLCTQVNNNDKLNPWFVTGYADGEGCFNILVIKSRSNTIGWQIQPRFIIEVNIKDIDLLYKIQAFFGGIGSITSTKSRARFSVFAFKDVANVILTHFDNYPLQSAKQIDFELWKKCVNIMLNKEHLTQKGLEQIISYKGGMNFGESDV